MPLGERVASLRAEFSQVAYRVMMPNFLSLRGQTRTRATLMGLDDANVIGVHTVETDNMKRMCFACLFSKDFMTG